MDLKERAKQLAADVPALFLALKRPDTPLLAKVLAATVVIYALSPIDLIPDFIPVIGYLDDVILLPILVALTVRLIPASVFAECREEARGMWANSTPGKWYYALPVVIIWLLIVAFIVKLIWF